MDKIARISKDINLDDSDLKRLGFESEFDWKQEQEDSIVLAMIRHKIIVGLISFDRIVESSFNIINLIEVSRFYRNKGVSATLLAVVMNDSFYQVFEGYVQLVSKTKTIDFYCNLGGFCYKRIVTFDSFASYKVIEKYLWG